MLRALLVAAVLTSTAGCKNSAKSDPGPACPAVVDHMLEVMKAGLTGHDSVALGNREQMIAQCEQRKMPPETRRCLAGAKTLNDLASCRPTTPPPATSPRPAPPIPSPTPAPPSPAFAAPAGSGSGT